MMSSFPTMTLGDLITHQKGFAFKSNDYQDDGIPVVRVSNFTHDSISQHDLKFVSKIIADENQKVALQEDDVIIATVGSWPNNPASIVGKIVRVPSELAGSLMNQNSVILRVRSCSEVDQKYLFFALKTKQFSDYIVSTAQGSANQASITLGDIFAYEIEWPEKDVRKSIVNIIESLSKKIRLNTQTNQTLESIAQAIFKSWFVDFEPVKAKMAALAEDGTREQAELAAMGAISGKSEAELAQLQQQNPKHYQQLAETATLFPSAMLDSELGAIPEGWEVAPIGNLIESTIGGDWGKEEPDDKHQVQVRIIRGTDIPNIKTCNDKAVPTRFVEEKKLKNRALMFGDIVIEVSGGSPTQPTGRSIFISKEILARMEYPVAPASFCRLFRPKSIDMGFFIGIYLQIIYVEGKTWLYQNQSTGISNFQTTVFLEKELLAIPSNLLIESFVKTISPIIGKMNSNENSKLAELRDSLLPKLLSGEIDLTEIQSEMA